MGINTWASLSIEPPQQRLDPVLLSTKMLSRAARPALRAGAAASVRPIPQNAANFATLREIEDRLKSIRNIEKITKTMKIVASTKLNRAQRAMTDSRSYGQNFQHRFRASRDQGSGGREQEDFDRRCQFGQGTLRWHSLRIVEESPQASRG